MSKRRKKSRGMMALARRYGHFGMEDVHKGTAGVRKLASDNPMVSAAVMGGVMGAIGAGLGVGSAILVGAGVGVAVEQTLKK